MTSSADQAVADERRPLLGLAYRLLGSFSDAEDAVQEAYVRWYRLTDAERAAIASPGAWLTTTASRICLDMLGSARARRERYVGEWLPEPLPGSDPAAAALGQDPADRVSLDESVSMALMVVLETLTPAERVAFVLHDVFRYTFDEIAQVVGRSAGACRELASSARRRIRDSRADVNPGRSGDAIVQEFKRALESGDMAKLVELLDPSVTAIADGGGIVRATIKPIYGADRVARLLLHFHERNPDTVVETAEVNGQLGLVLRSGEGELVAVVAMHAPAGKIESIWAMRNPEKLGAWG